MVNDLFYEIIDIAEISKAIVESKYNLIILMILSIESCSCLMLLLTNNF